MHFFFFFGNSQHRFSVTGTIECNISKDHFDFWGLKFGDEVCSGIWMIKCKNIKRSDWVEHCDNVRKPP